MSSDVKCFTSKIQQLTGIIACCISTTCFAGGGPNPFEGTSISTLWILPIIGYVCVFFVMAITGKFLRAVCVSLFVVALMVASGTSGDIIMLLILLLGPWILFVILLIASFFPANSPQKPESTESREFQPTEPLRGESLIQ